MKSRTWVVIVAVLASGLMYAGGTALELQREREAAASALFEAQQALSALDIAAEPASEPASTAVAPLVTPLANSSEAAELREALANKEKEIQSLRGLLAKAQEAREAPREERRGRESFQERMETLKEEDPEEYKRIQDERSAWRQEMKQRTNDRLAFFESVPTDGLSEEYAESHAELLKRVKFFDDAMQQMSEDPDGELSREMRDQMRENFRGTRELLEREREILLNDLVTDLGFPDDVGQEVLDYLQHVNEMTSMDMGGGRGRGGDRGGGRGGR